MPLSRWLLLLAIVIGFGCLQVAQRNALFFKGYAVAERMSRLHRQETDVSRLHATVTGLVSPTRLSRIAQDRHLKLVAWSTISPMPSLATAGSIDMRQEQNVASVHARPLVHIAAIDPSEPSLDDDTSD